MEYNKKKNNHHHIYNICKYLFIYLFTIWKRNRNGYIMSGFWSWGYSRKAFIILLLLIIMVI